MGNIRGCLDGLRKMGRGLGAGRRRGRLYEEGLT
jgi:hypothetical protein